MKRQFAMMFNHKTRACSTFAFATIYAASLVLVLCGALPNNAAAESAANNSMTLALPQVRALALDSLRTNKPDLAYKLGRGLLHANSKDPIAHYIIAKALQHKGAPGLARRSAARAFRHSAKKPDRFFAAQLAAQLAYSDNRYTLSQYWLRRSLISAPTPKIHAQTIKDFKRIRAQNPWSVRMKFSFRPSTNVNSGSNFSYLLIDDVPIVGTLSGSAQALSGMVATADIAATYRLRTNAKSTTRLETRFYRRHVFLSQDARDQAPSVGNSDFTATTIEAGISHLIAMGSGRKTQGAAGKSYGIVRATFGKSWYAGSPLFTFGKVKLDRALTLTNGQNLRFSGSYEHRSPASALRTTTRIYQLRGDYTHKFSGGNSLTAGLVVAKTQSETVNTASTRATGYIAFAPARAFGPAHLSLNIGTSLLDYESYSVGLISVPGGRRDKTIFANLAVTFDKFDYAGFIPTLSIKAQKSNSNISRFDTTELSIAIGIRSSF